MSLWVPGELHLHLKWFHYYCLTQSEWESTMLQEGQPENVMYGWCVKCRLRYQEKFQALRG